MKKLRTRYLFKRKGNELNLKKMKLTFLFSFLVFTGAWANSYSQAAKLSLNLKDVTVQELIQEIEDKTDFYFLYQDEVFEKEQRVTIQVRNESLDSILKELEKQAFVKAEITEHQIILKKKVLDLVASAQQKKQVMGIVTDLNGRPIPGVSVVVKGTTTGTVTDVEGKFQLEVPVSTEVLQFSFVGMKKQEVAIAGKTLINIVMEEETIGLEEVVAIGYGTMKKSDLTGSVASAKIEALREVANVNIGQSLQGLVPGLNVGAVNTAGADPIISIRGATTLSGNQNVLMVLDGIIFNGSLSSLNPDDIASIDVLKDASSTAIYGAQAANGVLLITTKKGQSDKPRINISSQFATQTPATLLTPMNREEFLQKNKDLYWEFAFLPPDYITPNPDFSFIPNLDKPEPNREI